MAKTGKQVQGDVRKLLLDSTLYAQINGECYREGYRPRNSRKEDAVIIYTTGIPDQIQTGVVTINVYVPDIDPNGDGVWVEDGERCERIEELAQAWVDSLSADVSSYQWELRSTIYTEAEEDIHQHYIVIRLGYRYYGDDDYDDIITPQEALLDAMDEDEDDGYLPILTTEDGEDVSIVPAHLKQPHSNNPQI